MTQWLAPILGVIVVGVVIELITKESRLGKFIRAIYAFFVLFVIVQPLPQLFGKLDFFNQSTGIQADAAMVDQITGVSKQAQIQHLLTQLGYADALVCVQNGVVYINLGQAVSVAELQEIKAQIGEGEVYIL